MGRWIVPSSKLCFQIILRHKYVRYSVGIHCTPDGQYTHTQIELLDIGQGKTINKVLHCTIAYGSGSTVSNKQTTTKLDRYRST